MSTFLKTKYTLSLTNPQSIASIFAVVYSLFVFSSMSIEFDESGFDITTETWFNPINPVVRVHGGDMDLFNMLAKHFEAGEYEIIYTVRNGFILRTFVKVLRVR